jgi:Fur family transcriptional regulator, ferric uptake regulator
MNTAKLGQRNTRQREILQRIFTQAPGPLGVRKLLELAQAEIGKMGIATVYRTLRLLEESKEIRPVTLPDGEIQWESSDRGHHHHFVCRSCSTVTDFAGCPVHVHAEALPQGFQVETHELTLVGLCAKCSSPASAAKPRKAAKPGS